MQKKFKHGLVVGKFYPPHKGHKFLIDTAITQCDIVTVMVIFSKGETIPVHKRKQWIEKIHPTVYTLTFNNSWDPIIKDDESDQWGKETIFELDQFGCLGEREDYPFLDAVFSSEDYGFPYAEALTKYQESPVQHILVDKERVNVPISATLVRSNPMKYFEFLEPIVKGYFAFRIRIIGAESTGKTTLAKQLAKHYNTCWVPEYGRLFAEGKYPCDRNWTAGELEHIAEGQNKLEDALAESCSGILICDTDAHVTNSFHKRYLGWTNPVIERMERNYDLTFITDINVPWEDDGLRSWDAREETRLTMHENYLNQNFKNFYFLEGNPQKRFEDAVRFIDDKTIYS